MINSLVLQPPSTPDSVAKALHNGDRMVVVDVRTVSEYRAGHIAGSLNIPMDEIESRIADIPAGYPVVLVCQSGRRAEITKNMTSEILDKTVCLEGGMEAWQKQGKPVVRSVRTRMALDRQSMLVASVLVLTSFALGRFVSPGWYALSLLPGLGLLTASTTGFCLMANILAFMPWNKPRS